MVLNESSSLDWSAIECDALGSTFPRMKFHEISLKITSKFIRFFYNGWSTTVIHSPKRMNKQLFFFIERKDFRDRRRTNLFELRVYVRLLKRSPLSGIVVTEKAATRMKFDAVSSKAVGTISDYQQPRQNRVFGKSSFVIRTVSADYECLAQALRYAHPLPLLLTRSVFSRSSMILCHSFQLFSFELVRLSTSFEFIVLIFYLGNLLLFSISRAKLLFSFNERLVIAPTPWISKLGVEKWRR